MNAILGMMGINTTAIKGTITLILIAVLGLSGIGLYFWVKHELAAKQKEVVELKEKNEVLVRDNSTLVEVNRTNESTILNLKNDQKLGRDSLNRLNSQLAEQRKSLAEISTSIKNSPKEADGQLAPVLKDALNSIQTLRDKKSLKGEPK